MTTYTNPTGTLDGTSGSDTIIFTAPTGGTTTTIDALGGDDSLTVQFDNPNALGFDVADVNNSGVFRVIISGTLTDPRIIVFHVEHIDFHGTANDDNFSLTVGPSSSALTASMDGAGGSDHLALDWSAMTTGNSFIVGSTGITSSLGSFSNFESFYVQAGSGDDTIVSGNNADFLVAGGGNDNLSAAGGDDTVHGLGGNDTINGDVGNDTLYGEAGDDTIDGGDGADTIYGDIIQTSFTGDGNDHLSGGLGHDLIYGGGGNDVIDGGDDIDELHGGTGADHVDGGVGNDFVFGSDSGLEDGAADVLLGGAGDDRIWANYGDTVDGGSGIDQLSFSAFGGSTGINVDFSQLTSGGTVTVGGATLTGIEYVIGIGGTDYSDTITAGAVPGPDGIIIDGWGGDDVLTGSAANDMIFGGDGNDTIYGGVGLNSSVAPAYDRLRGEAGNDTIYIGADGAEAFGGSGNDVIHGGSAADDIRGDDGDDILSGGGGHDGLYGGAGSDTFIDTAAGLNGDVIGDFAAGDKIVITNATLSGFTFNLSGNVLTYTGGSLTFGAPVEGTLVASAAAGGGVQIEVRLPPLGTVDAIANQLTSGYWGGSSHHWPVTQGGTITVNITGLTAAEQVLARTALGEWTDVIGVQFQEVASGGQIQFTHAKDPTAGGPVAQTDSHWSNGILTSATVQISQSWITQNGSSLNSYGFQAYVHEIGHALGLGHAGNYNFTGTYLTDAIFLNDGWPMSVMSYFDAQESVYFRNLGFTRNFAVTPMDADIVAMQSLYGLSTTTRTGNTTYGYNSNAGGVYDASAYPGVALTVFDSGGNDTLDYSGSGSAQQINLNAETFSSVNGSHGNLAIARDVVIENAIGGSANDIIVGNSAANVITGNASADILTGGAGNDNFQDTAAGLNGDTITDFSVGDRIIITDATLGNFTFSVSGNTLVYTGGTLTFGSVPAGHFAVTAAAGGGVEIVIETHAAANDFNGDGTSDVLWRRDDGALTDWLGNANGGYSGNAGNLLTVVDPQWQLAATGDFNGDGRFDLLWHRADGTITDWLGSANGGLTPNAANELEVVDPHWQIAGAGDFNGDGRDDILWRRDDGELTNWLGTANGSFNPNAAGLLTVVSADWQVAGVGDFNGDGRDDVLWRNLDGRITDWLGTADGGLSDNVANAYNAVSADWHVAGIGDFNGDGRDDILWRRDDGALTDWLGMASGGYAPNAANLLTVVSTDWHIAAIGDFNGDRRDDVLWRNDDGRITNWLGTSSGGFADNFANGYTGVDTHWHVEPHSSLV